MDQAVLAAFEDEMSKIAGFKDLWQSVLDLFRPADARVQRKVGYFFSPKAGKDKWDKLLAGARDKKFVDGIVSSPFADDRLIEHVKSLHDLARGKPVAKIQSDTAPGKSYEVRELGNGQYGCQCGDWRYKGSVRSGYQCKHIRAHLEGKSRA